MATQNDQWDYLSTECALTGGSCSPGLSLALQLTRSIDRGGPALADGFELTGVARTSGCGRECPLTFRVTRKAAWVVGGVEQGTDADGLVHYAQGFFNDEPGIAVPPSGCPRALVRALPASSIRRGTRTTRPQ